MLKVKRFSLYKIKAIRKKNKGVGITSVYKYSEKVVHKKRLSSLRKAFFILYRYILTG